MDLFKNFSEKNEDALFSQKAKKDVGADGIYRIDLKKCEKGKPYRAVVRFLPNLKRDMSFGPSFFEKTTHYVDLTSVQGVSGYYDSPKTIHPETNQLIGKTCPLSDLYYSLTNSNNEMLKQKAKCLKYGKKYFSYVLVIEDNQQPELVGKIMVFQYGKTIQDKIIAEKDGTITGEECKIHDFTKGKDFVLLVKEITTGDQTYPDYKESQFRPKTSSMSIAKDGVVRPLPLDGNGEIDAKYNQVVTDFLFSREVEMEDFYPKAHTDEVSNKIDKITEYLTGKATVSSTDTNRAGNIESFDDITSDRNAVTANDDDDIDDFLKNM